MATEMKGITNLKETSAQLCATFTPGRNPDTDIDGYVIRKGETFRSYPVAREGTEHVVDFYAVPSEDIVANGELLVKTLNGLLPAHHYYSGVFVCGERWNNTVSFEVPWVSEDTSWGFWTKGLIIEDIHINGVEETTCNLLSSIRKTGQPSALASIPDAAKKWREQDVELKIIERGFVLSKTNTLPTINDTKVLHSGSANYSGYNPPVPTGLNYPSSFFTEAKQTSNTISGLSNGTLYYVRSYGQYIGDNGTVKTVYGPVTSFTTKTPVPVLVPVIINEVPTMVEVPVPVSTPANVIAVASIGKITVIWDQVEYAQSYTIQRRSSQGIVKTVNTSSVVYIDNDVENYVTYYYKIMALHNTKGNSGWSKEVNATPIIPTVTTVIPPSVRPLSTNTLTSNSAIIVSEILNKGSGNLTNYGVLNSGSYTVGYGLNNSQYNTLLTNLNRCSQYTIKSYVNSSSGNALSSNTISFYTKQDKPRLLTIKETERKPHSCRLNGKIDDNGGSDIIDVGFYISLLPNVGEGNGNKTSCNLDSNNNFSVLLTGLLPNTRYYYKTYAKNDDFLNYTGLTGYGTELSFVTQEFLPMPTPNLPIATNVTTDSITWTCTTPGAKILIEGLSGEFTSPKTLDNLDSNTLSRARTYTPGDGIYFDNSVKTAYVDEMTLRLAIEPPYLVEATDTTLKLADSDTTAIIVLNGPGCVNIEHISGSVWTSLTPNSEYTAYAYLPETLNNSRSVNSSILTIRTLKTRHTTPTIPHIIELSSRTVKLSVPENNAIINCNSELKNTNSIWTWLTPLTAYQAYAYIEEDETYRRSLDSEILNFITLDKPDYEPDFTVIGFMNNGSRACVEYLDENINITSSNTDVVEIRGNQILLISSGRATITYEVDGIITTSEIIVS